MTFTTNIPNTGQSLGFTKNPIRNNLSVLRSTIATNHIDVNLSGAGKHNLAEFVEQATAPATSVDECALYAKQAQSVAQLFLQKEGQLAGAPDVQMSRLDKGVNAALAGWTFLPGGLIMQWGSCGVVNGAFTTIYTAQGGVAFTTNTYSVMLTVDDPGSPESPITSFTTQASTFTATEFQGHTNRSITLRYLAIGV